MERKEYHTVDKTEWGYGPWRDEPDKIQWQDEVTGLPCLIVRNPGGALCGYVGVPEGHPFYKVPYHRGPDTSVQVHGGLTFSNMCMPNQDESTGICHVPGEGDPDNVWWFGFDCAHYGDECPKWNVDYNRALFSGTYRDIAYVAEEVAQLAVQLKNIQPKLLEAK